MAEDLITIATFHRGGEADAARLHLESEGFTVFLANIESTSILSSAASEIKLQVPKSEAEMAAVHLRKMQAKRRDRVEGEDFGENTCLACGAEIPEDESRCPVCGWSYQDG